MAIGLQLPTLALMTLASQTKETQLCLHPSIRLYYLKKGLGGLNTGSRQFNTIALKSGAGGWVSQDWAGGDQFSEGSSAFQ